jgi:hypothetical protein
MKMDFKGTIKDDGPFRLTKLMSAKVDVRHKVHWRHPYQHKANISPLHHKKRGRHQERY